MNSLHTESTRETRTATVLVTDDRPLVRAGLRAALVNLDDPARIVDGPVGDAIDLIESHRPQVLVTVVRGDDPAPYRVIATAKGLQPEVRVLALADEVGGHDLREAVIAGADGFLLTSASLGELRSAIERTARGERVVSPEVAMHLVDAWRPDSGGGTGATLTPREMEVLEQLAEGLTNQEIAERLDVSPRTIKTHVQNLLAKLDVPDRTGAVARGFRLGLIS